MIHLLPINSEIVLQNSRPPGTNVHWLVSHISCILMHFTHLYGILPWESILRRNWVSRGGPIATQSMLPGLDGMTTNGNTWLKGNTAFSSVAGIWCGKDVASEMLFSWQRSGQQHSRICVLLSTRRWQSSRGPKRHCCEEFQCHKSGTWLVWVFWVWMNHEPLAATDVYLHPPIWMTPEGSTGTFRFRICGFLHLSHHIIAQVPRSDHWDGWVQFGFKWVQSKPDLFWSLGVWT